MNWNGAKRPAVLVARWRSRVSAASASRPRAMHARSSLAVAYEPLHGSPSRAASSASSVPADSCRAGSSAR